MKWASSSVLTAIFIFAIKSETVEQSSTAQAIDQVSKLFPATARALFNLSP